MEKFRKILSSILAVPITALTLLIMAIRSVVTAPWAWLRYRKTPFYRDFGEKFRVFDRDSVVRPLYDLIRERNLPIRFLPEDPARPSKGGWFLYKGTLIVHDLRMLRYHEKDNRWLVRGSTPLMEYILDQVQQVNRRPGHEECTQMLLPIDRRQIVQRDLDRAEKDFRFLLYDKGELGEILDAYVRTHPHG